jgi:small GTP-binding protein
VGGGDGKYALLRRFSSGVFEDSFIARIGIDFKVRTLDVDGTFCKLQVWVTTGNKRFRTINSSYYRSATLFMVCFALDDEESFQSVKEHLSDIDRYSAERPLILLVGMKCDRIERRVVSYARAYDFASSLGYTYWETSAKTGYGVGELFNFATRLCIAKFVDKIDIVQAVIDKLKQNNRLPADPFSYQFLNDDEWTQLLNKSNFNTEVTDEHGQTPLIITIGYGCLKSAKLLIEKGANVNASDSDGVTPLIKAANNRCVEIVKLLIEKGANVNASDSDGVTPLIKAANNGSVEIVKLLIEKGANVNAFDKNGVTSLMNATNNKRVEIVKLLIEKGANVNAFDKKGVTSLIKAADNKSVEVVKLLIEKGAKDKLSDVIKIITNPPKLPFYLERRREVIELFLKKEPDVNARNIGSGIFYILPDNKAQQVYCKQQGDIEYGLNHYEEAIFHYGKAIELNSNEAAYFYLRGNAKHRLGCLNAAILDYDKAIDLDPLNATYYNARGNTTFVSDRKNIKQVISYCNITLELESGNVFALENEAFAYLFGGLLTDAKALFNHVIAIKRENQDIKRIQEYMKIGLTMLDWREKKSEFLVTEMFQKTYQQIDDIYQKAYLSSELLAAFFIPCERETFIYISSEKLQVAYREVLKMINQTIIDCPKEFFPHYYRAQLLLLSNHTSAARNELMTCLALSPKADGIQSLLDKCDRPNTTRLFGVNIDDLLEIPSFMAEQEIHREQIVNGENIMAMEQNNDLRIDNHEINQVEVGVKASSCAPIEINIAEKEASQATDGIETGFGCVTSGLKMGN